MNYELIILLYVIIGVIDVIPVFIQDRIEKRKNY